jgi:hypothetical protein
MDFYRYQNQNGQNADVSEDIPVPELAVGIDIDDLTGHFPQQ